MIVKPPWVRTITPSGSRTRDSGAGGGRSNKERQRLQLLASVARAPLCEVRRVRYILNKEIAIWHETLMEQWIGSVHSKMAWQTHLFFYLPFIAFWKRALQMYLEQQIRMISEGLCITKDWSYDAENSALDIIIFQIFTVLLYFKSN